MLQTLLLKIKNALNFLIYFSKFSFLHLATLVDDALPASRPRRKCVIVGFFSLPVLGAVVAFAGLDQKADTSNPKVVSAEIILEPIALDVSQQSAFSLLPLVKQERIEHGDHLTNVLERVGANAEGLVSYLAKNDIGKQLFKQFRAGSYLSVQLDQNNDVVWVRYKLNKLEDHMESILVKRIGEKQYEASLEKIKFDKEIAFRSGRIDSTLFSAADQADLPDSVAIKMAEVFSSQIDFHRELRKGDEFRVVYEQMLLNGEPVGSGKVLALEFINDGDQHKAYYFEPSDGTFGYYDADGNSLRTAFLRSPLRFSRISSGFSLRRYHPIQKRWKAHYGVDYAAPTGTPIMATGDGRVSFAGRKGGYGNVVYLKHHSGYSTRYAHMSRFSKGIRNGSKVKQGQVIGYVGATGWATGPHLHYEFRKHSKPKNPLRVKLKSDPKPLNKNDRHRFKVAQTALEHRLNLASTIKLASSD